VYVYVYARERVSALRIKPTNIASLLQLNFHILIGTASSVLGEFSRSPFELTSCCSESRVICFQLYIDLIFRSYKNPY